MGVDGSGRVMVMWSRIGMLVERLAGCVWMEGMEVRLWLFAAEALNTC